MGGFSILPEASQPLPRRLDFVKPRSLQNGFIHGDSKPPGRTTAAPARVPLQTRWTKTFGAASGLHNLGNTCFLNSILQCLTHTAPLANVVLGQYGAPPCARKPFCFLCFLKGHIPAALAGGQPRAPRALVSNLRLVSRSFKPGRQEDAHEFLCKCLEALEKSCQPRLVDAVFGGKFRSRVRCQECSYASDAFDPFQDISLEIIRANSVVSALKHFTAPEILSGNNKYLCSGCKKRVVADKRLTIDQAPPVLTVQLKRFTYTGAKVGKPIQYEHRLDLGPFLSDQGQSVVYNLFGLVVHIGSGPRSGHYIAYVKSAAGPWYLMDDSSVRKIGADAVLKEKPYLLFYVRESPEPVEHPVSNQLEPPKAIWTAFKEIVGMDAASRLPSGGDAAPNEEVGGGSAEACPVEEVGCAVRRRIPLFKQWRYYPLAPTTIPPGQVFMRTLKTFKSVQPASIAAWDETGDQIGKMRVLREHRDKAIIAQRSEYDREYDQGKVRKVRNRQHLENSTNHFQDIVNKRIRSS